MIHTDFGQIITAMVTPFSASGDVDVKEAIRLGEHLVDTGTSTILLAGTTGESPTLTHQEEFDLFSQFVAHFKGKAKIMAGTGSNSTKTAVDSTKKAAEIGVDAVLQVVPYYNKPSQEGIYRHFKTVADATSVPVLLYNIPGRTGMNMDPSTMARLADCPTVFGVKEAAGSPEQVAQIRAAVPDEFQIYSGDDGLTLDFMDRGACGVVSVASHVAGKQISEMLAAYTTDKAAARAIESKLKPLFDVLFITSNPSPVKAALEMIGFSVGEPRLPLVKVTDDEYQQVKIVLRDVLSL